MATFNPKSGGSNNNTGSVKSGGTLSNLAATKLSNNIKKKISETQIQIVSVNSTPLTDGIHLGQENKSVQGQLKDYTFRVSNPSLLTGKGTNSDVYSVFTLGSGLTNTNRNIYWTYGKNAQQQISTYSAPVIRDYSLTTLSATQTLQVKDYALGYSFFTGNVSPSGNETHTKLISVRSEINGMTILNKTYEIDAWSKLNLNFIPPITHVTISVSGDPNPVILGKSTLFQRSTQLSRTGINVVAPISTPIHYVGRTNLTLQSDEVSFKYVATDDMMLVVAEIDPNGNASPNVFQIVPSGSTFEYYPAYKNLGIATIVPTDYSLDTRTITVSTYK
jgi:hypothetical protein